LTRGSLVHGYVPEQQHGQPSIWISFHLILSVFIFIVFYLWLTCAQYCPYTFYFKFLLSYFQFIFIWFYAWLTCAQYCPWAATCVAFLLSLLSLLYYLLFDLIWHMAHLCTVLSMNSNMRSV
jgi:hypothetical protein